MNFSQTNTTLRSDKKLIRNMGVIVRKCRISHLRLLTLELQKYQCKYRPDLIWTIWGKNLGDLGTPKLKGFDPISGS